MKDDERKRWNQTELKKAQQAAEIRARFARYSRRELEKGRDLARVSKRNPEQETKPWRRLVLLLAIGVAMYAIWRGRH